MFYKYFVVGFKTKKKNTKGIPRRINLSFRNLIGPLFLYDFGIKYDKIKKLIYNLKSL